MNLLVFAAGLLLVMSALWEAFETMVLPRTVMRRIRLTRFYYEITWLLITTVVKRTKRNNFLLAVFGPMSLLGLIGCWALMFIFGFALMQQSMGTKTFDRELYESGSTFFTLGLGDETPQSNAQRFLVVVEAGLGFAVLAIVIGYLPVLYQSFSRRESEVALMTAHAKGSPNALQVLEFPLRHSDADTMIHLLRRWEEWAAELHESFISYPMLAYYRSQQDSTSWLASLVIILDVCALLQTRVTKEPEWLPRVRDHAELTASMVTRTLKVLCRVLRIEPTTALSDRLLMDDLSHLVSRLTDVGLPLELSETTLKELNALRLTYEPAAFAIADHLFLKVLSFYKVES